MATTLKMALPLLIMVLATYITTEAALLRKSSATDFLTRGREKRSPECSEVGCSIEENEPEELLESKTDYDENLNLGQNGGTKTGKQQQNENESNFEEGSGM